MKINAMTPGQHNHSRRKLKEAQSIGEYKQQAELTRRIGFHVPVDTGEYREWRR